MPARWISVFCAIGLGAAASVAAAVQPARTDRENPVRIVHRPLGLVDICIQDTDGAHRSRIERRGGGDGRGLGIVARPGETVRLTVRPGDEVRIVGTPGSAPAGWFDAMAVGVAAPAAVETPGWALGAVWYNVFPERFDNAEPTNDQGWPHGTPIAWGQAWGTVTADEFEASANRAIALPRVYGDDHARSRPVLRDTVFERRFGGDLEGVIRRLDHIHRLGADVLWLCPVFRAASLHKYDATDHRHVDPHLAGRGSPSERGEPTRFDSDPDAWCWTEADRVLIDGLLPAARRRGVRVILDGVWNHVGIHHPAFEDAVLRGPASAFWDWFEIRQDADGGVSSWRAWDGRSGRLPVFRQLRGTLADGPKAHVFAVTRRWMDPDGDGDPSDGIDGWRLDVANEVGIPFWREWRALTRSINPESVLVGELWFDGGDYFEGVAFDAQMNYPLAFALTAWLGRDPNFTTAELVAALKDRVLTHHPATVLAQVNLVSSHDTPRFVSMLANPGRAYDRDAGLADAAFDRSRPADEVFDLVELGYAVLTVLPGSPMVYNGDELGMWSADDPENRQPIPWPDLGLRRPSVEPEHAGAMIERVRRWLTLRRDPVLGPVLRHGDWAVRAAGDLLIIERSLDGVQVELIANRGGEPGLLSGTRIPPRSARLHLTRDGGRADATPD